jgi:E3 ubiquitin-protein ligase TRIP12
MYFSVVKQAYILTLRLQNVSFASFLSSILTSRDDEGLVTGALQLAELLLVKLPTIYSRSFQREGVVYEIDKLAAEEISLSTRSKRKAETPKSATVETASQSGVTDADKPSKAPTPSENAATDAAAASARLLRVLAGEDASASTLSAFERALGVAGTRQTSTSRRVSSVPSNPHDANIVRAKILQVKRWSLEDTARSAPTVSSSVDAVIQQLSDSNISDSDLRKAFDQIAGLLTDRGEPLSSFEMLQSGLLSRLMAMLQEGTKGRLGNRFYHR